MEVREKLVDLAKPILTSLPFPWCTVWRDVAEKIADAYIANGVTVQRWIPVTERFPDTIPCGAGREYSEAVNVLTTGRKVLTAIWDGMDFIANAEFWEVDGEEITHWASVPLPLPEPPKEEE